MDRTSSACPKLPFCMGQEEKPCGWKARALERKSRKGKKIPYLPPSCKPCCGRCGSGMMMFLLCSVAKKLDMVFSKQKEQGAKIQELTSSTAKIQAVLKKGSRSSKCNFFAPVSIAGLQMCADGTNNLTMHSSGTKRKTHESFQPGANVETDFKTSPPMAENDQEDNDIRQTDCDFDRSVKDDEQCKINLDHCHDTYGDDVCCHANQGVQHDQDCLDALHGIAGDREDNWDFTKRDLWDIDDGGNLLGLSNLSDLDLSNVGTSSHASDHSDLKYLSDHCHHSESSHSGQGTAMETFPELDETAEAGMERSEEPVLSCKVSSECVDRKRRKWSTSIDPPFAVPQTNSRISEMNDAYDGQSSPGKGKCAVQSGGAIFKGREGHARLTDSPRQWPERSLSSSPVVQTDPHCLQTGNSMEDPERTLTSGRSDLGQIANDKPEYERALSSIAPCSVKATQETLESGGPVLATVVAETDNVIKGPFSATLSDYVNSSLSDSLKSDKKYEHTNASPVSSEADHGVEDFKGSTFAPSFDHGMVSDGSKEYAEPVCATSDIVKDDRDMNALCGTTKPDRGTELECKDPSCAIVSGCVKDGNGTKFQHEESTRTSLASFVEAGNGSKKHQRCMSATVSHTGSAEKNTKKSERFLSALNIRSAQAGEGLSGMKRSLSANCLDSSQIDHENGGSEPFQTRVSGNVGAGTRSCVLASERSITTISVGPGDSISGKDCQASQFVTLPYPVQSDGDVADVSFAAPVLDSA